MYLKGTFDHGLRLKRSMNLDIIGFCDADWASDPDDKRSTTGFCVYLGSNLISWNLNKQNIVSRSSTEAKYKSLATLAAKVTWIQSLLIELQIPQGLFQYYGVIIWVLNSCQQILFYMLAQNTLSLPTFCEWESYEEWVGCKTYLITRSDCGHSDQSFI